MSGYHLPIINRSEIPYMYIHTNAGDRREHEWRERRLSYIENYYNVAFSDNRTEPDFTIPHVGNNIL
jgi:hypothetical protein